MKRQKILEKSWKNSEKSIKIRKYLKSPGRVVKSIRKVVKGPGKVVIKNSKKQ